MDILFLGTGTSFGVPMIGCKCDVCRSDNPRNKRTRASVLFQYGGHSVLVDTSIDMRQQFLVNDISSVDAVLYTHAHADHLHGLDDLRSVTSRNGLLHLYANAETVGTIRQSFSYLFDGGDHESLIPDVSLHTLESGPFDLFGEIFWPIDLDHGSRRILGYRVHDIAYLTDCSNIPEESIRMLGNLEVLVIDAVRFRPHPTHFSVDEALEVIEILSPTRAWLTHLCHDLEHDTVNEMLPENVRLAFDGLRDTVA